MVKRIGDAVMFATPAARVAAQVAAELVRSFERDPVVPPVRVGIVAGAVVARRGDFYGLPVVLAARLVLVARPASALLSAEVARRLRGARALGDASERRTDVGRLRRAGPGLRARHRLIAVRAPFDDVQASPARAEAAGATTAAVIHRERRGPAPRCAGHHPFEHVRRIVELCGPRLGDSDDRRQRRVAARDQAGVGADALHQLRSRVTRRCGSSTVTVSAGCWTIPPRIDARHRFVEHDADALGVVGCEGQTSIGE